MYPMKSSVSCHYALIYVTKQKHIFKVFLFISHCVFWCFQHSSIKGLYVAGWEAMFQHDFHVKERCRVSFINSVWFPGMISRSEEEKSSMVAFRLYVWEWIRFTEIALCGDNEDPRGMCEQPSNYPKVLPNTASDWDIWMQKGFIWRAFFPKSEILLVLARNTLIRVFTQESVLL